MEDEMTSRPAPLPEPWRPMDTAPTKDKARVLLADGLGSVEIGWWCPHRELWIDYLTEQEGDHVCLAPMAWAPLPAHPDYPEGFDWTPIDPEDEEAF